MIQYNNGVKNKLKIPGVWLLRSTESAWKYDLRSVK